MGRSTSPQYFTLAVMRKSLPNSAWKKEHPPPSGDKRARDRLQRLRYDRAINRPLADKPTKIHPPAGYLTTPQPDHLPETRGSLAMRVIHNSVTDTDSDKVNDIWATIITLLDLPSLLKCATVSSHWRALVKKELELTYNAHLRQMGFDPVPFRKLLQMGDAVLIGQFPLAMIERRIREWDITHIHVACPWYTFGRTVDTLRRVHGVVFAGEARRDVLATVPETLTITGVLGEVPSRKRITVHRSPYDNPLGEAVTPQCTVDANVLTADSLVCAFPRLTLMKRGLYGPDHAAVDTNVIWYWEHGWDLRWSARSWFPPGGPCAKDAYDAHAWRHLGDGKCLQFAFDTDSLQLPPSFHDGTRYLPFTTTTRFRRGGICIKNDRVLTEFAFEVATLNPQGSCQYINPAVCRDEHADFPPSDDED
ncbi:hypothetical protein EUX98_g7643 [Antrodiella citrinella]|uniref:F-box domain-containing protein n=1 Tax=Antrodiella citrinella TaxID=2447956 RepID=A0A4S4ML18_9APHY|nr:hypothetical protein EUX98_g7643 [Antrodiella citrinella]